MKLLERDGKPVTQGNPLYPDNNHMIEEDEIEFDRFILNLDTELINQIELFVAQEKTKGQKLRDIKTGKMKKINKSLWARKVFAEALEKEAKKEQKKIEAEQRRIEALNKVQEDVSKDLNLTPSE